MTAQEASASGTIQPALQVRRAWLVLLSASLIFAVVVVSGILAGRWAYQNATAPETATLSVLSGSGGALVRSPTDADWRLVTGETTVSEGDRISTALGTVVRLTMFDGSTVEVAEDSIVRVARMRTSRFLERTKLIVIEPQQGTVYVSMVPRGDYDFSEIAAQYNTLQVRMSDESGRNDAGSFLIEVGEIPAQARTSAIVARVAVLRGKAVARWEETEQQLRANEQTLVSPDGTFSMITPAVRELVVNGEFSQGLAGWIEFEQVSQRYSGNPSGGLVELAPDRTTLGNHVTVELARAGADESVAQVGIRQPIGKTLRVHTSLRLQFEARIVSQEPAGGGPELAEFPLMIEINYVDVDGHERQWRHGCYAIDDPIRHIPQERATKLQRDTWQRIIFDLRNLSPAPKQITSIVVYASGQSYQTRVANISLTTSELDSTP